MRKLKLQIQMTLDGFVGGPNGENDWVFATGRDEAVFQKVIELADGCDTILLGRKMATGFIAHWENVVNNIPDSVEHPLAHLMVKLRKIIFSKTETTISGANAEVETSDVTTAIQALKKKPGKDIMVYGGAGFASSLISLGLIDEYYIFRCPIAIGQGLSIFKEKKAFKLESSTAFKNGKVLNKYLPV